MATDQAMTALSGERAVAVHRIAAAAICLPNGKIISMPPPARHPDLLIKARAEAAGQILPQLSLGGVTLYRKPAGKLFSEDVW